MDACPVCGEKISHNSKLIIMSNKIDRSFYSKKCIKKFVENPDKYISATKLNYYSYKIENGKKVNIDYQFQDKLRWKKITINQNLKPDEVS